MCIRDIRERSNDVYGLTFFLFVTRRVRKGVKGEIFTSKTYSNLNYIKFCYYTGYVVQVMETVVLVLCVFTISDKLLTFGLSRRYKFSERPCLYIKP